VGTPTERNRHLTEARVRTKLTQQQTAEEVESLLGRTVEAEYISRLERGVVRWPNRDVRLALRRHFKVESDAELGFYGPYVLMDSDVSKSQRAPCNQGKSTLFDGEITVPARGIDGKVVFVSISRRVFMESAPFFGMAVTPVDSSRESRIKALDAGANPLEHFAEVKRIITDSDNLFGPARVIDIALLQVELMEQLRNELRGNDRVELVRIQTQYADLLAWLFQDSGDYVNAIKWANRSLEWSHLGRDTQATAFMLARRSQLAADMGDLNNAVDAAEAAIELAASGSRIEAIAYTYAGHGHALQRDIGLSDRSYGRAGEIIGKDYRTSLTPPSETYGNFFNHSYLQVHQAQSLVSLGRPVAAIEIFRGAISALPPNFHRDRGVYIAREAQAHAANGAAVEAASLGIRALAVASETGSARIFRELGHVDNSLGQWSTVKEVRQFRDALNNVIPRQV
jgi:tetratricopeptide (TPR) repeat protein